MADTAANVERFGWMGSGPKASAYPKLHVAAVAECGSHAVVGAVLGGCRTGERTLAADLTSAVGPGMLVMADAGLYSYELFHAFAATGADLAWRIGASVSVGHLTVPSQLMLDRWPGEFGILSSCSGCPVMRRVVRVGQGGQERGEDGGSVRVLVAVGLGDLGSLWSL